MTVEWRLVANARLANGNVVGLQGIVAKVLLCFAQAFLVLLLQASPAMTVFISPTKDDQLTPLCRMQADGWASAELQELPQDCLPPEARSASASYSTEKADIWVAGAMLYRMLSGERLA